MGAGKGLLTWRQRNVQKVWCMCTVLHGNKRSLYLLTQRNYGIIRNFGKKQTHENCSWCQDLTVTIFAGTPFVQELLFEIVYAGQSRNISKFGTHLSLSLPFKFPENPVGK